MIGIIAAMNVEMESLRSYMTDTTTETISGVTFVRGMLEGKEVVTAVCGIGKVFAALCAQTMILRYQPDAVINTGVAGTLSDKLSICSVAVSTGVVQHDMDTSPLGDPVGMISGINIVHIPADESTAVRFAAAAAALGIPHTTGTVASGDQFISDRAEKTRITETFGGVACEMEGAAVGQVCYVNDIPFAVLRAISDEADGTSPDDFGAFAAAAAKNSVAVLRRFLKDF